MLEIAGILLLAVLAFIALQLVSAWLGALTSKAIVALKRKG
jgi:hypothetical protein